MQAAEAGLHLAPSNQIPRFPDCLANLNSMKSSPHGRGLPVATIGWHRNQLRVTRIKRFSQACPGISTNQILLLASLLLQTRESWW